jgi:hypothetical protein
VLVSVVEGGDSRGGDRHRLGNEQRGVVGEDCFVIAAVGSVGSAELADRDRGLSISILPDA